MCCHGDIYKLLSVVVIMETRVNPPQELAAMTPGVAANCLHIPDALIKSL